MERAQHTKGEREESSSGPAPQGATPGRGTKEGEHDAPGGAQRGADGVGGGGGGAGPWEADAGLMNAMGLGGAGDGDKARDGITKPPQGKASGLATPEIGAQLDRKKDLQVRAGLGGTRSGGDDGASPGDGGAATVVPPVGGTTRGASPPTSGGGAVKPAGNAAGASPASGDHAQAPPGAPEAPEQAASPDGSAARGGGDDPGASAGSVEAMVEAMIDQLEHSEDPAARKHAAEALGKSKSPRARPALEKALRDRDPGVVAAATRALSQLGQLR